MLVVMIVVVMMMMMMNSFGDADDSDDDDDSDDSDDDVLVPMPTCSVLKKASSTDKAELSPLNGSCSSYSI